MSTFDETRFAADLDRMRAHIMAASRDKRVQDLGWVSSHSTSDESYPKFYIPFQKTALSNHERLQEKAWEEKTRDIFIDLHRALRSIPAFDNPGIGWSVSFRKSKTGMIPGIGAPLFRFAIMGALLSNGFVKTSEHAASRIAQIETLLRDVPRPAPARQFQIGDIVWPATCPRAAAQTWAALNNPGLLDGSSTIPGLPQIMEVLDHLAIERSLRTPA